MLVEKARRARAGVMRLMRERVLVAMSGGVDSSVAAALLVEQGYDVVGATMKLFCHGDDVPDRPCCSLDSVNDARRICEQLGVPHYVLNLESAFGHDVVRRLRRRVRARPHADPLRALQHVHEVPRPGAQGRRDRRALDRDGTLRARRSTACCTAGSIRRRISRTSSGGSTARVLVAHAAPGRRADEGGDARDRARAGPRADRREAREPGHLLRARRRPHARHRAQRSARTRRRWRAARSCCATARVVGEHDGLRAFTVGPAPRTAGRIRRADVRRRDRAGDARGGDRPARRAARPRRGGARGELARRRRPRVGRRGGGADPASRARRAAACIVRVDERRGRGGARRASERDQPRDSRACSTTASGCSAAG